MKIAVCLKQVASRDAPLQVDPTGHWLREQDTRYESNEADQYALEQALILKDSNTDVDVTVVCLGPERVSQTIKEALAKGADRAIHIDSKQPETLDPLQQAAAIAKAIGDEQIDLLLSGLQSDDLGFGQTGVMLASCLGLPHASMVVELQPQDTQLRVKRELEAGWHQWLSISLPCALTIQSGSNKPRYANMKGILAAKKKPLLKIPYTDLADDDIQTSQQLRAIYLPQKSKQTEFIEGNSEQIAASLLAKLNLSPAR